MNRTQGSMFAAIAAVCGVSGPAAAQSLLQQQGPPQDGPPLAARSEDPATRAHDVALSLQQYSLFAVVPPPPRQFQKQDIVQILINETSVQKFEQSLDRTKEYDLNGTIEQLPDLLKLLELRLEPGDRSPLAEVGATGESEFKGDGKVERKDQLTTRVSARIIEVKPNGLLLLEARKTVQSDSETSTVVVSGLCRPEDVTKSNTVQSTQLADLVIRVENEGEARDAAKRGVIPQVLDTIFNF